MTPYSRHIDKTLAIKITEKPVVLDLFAGCGGLSLGFESAGFETIGYEMVAEAAETYNKNLKGRCFCEKLSPGFIYPKNKKIDIVIGGPPCQPFSVFGNQLGMKDVRDGFPIFIDAVKRIKPKVFMFENVRNLAFSHKDYLELILTELRNLGYIISYKVMNASRFGVPQNRERLIVVGHKSQFIFPKELQKSVTVGDALGDIMETVTDEKMILTPRQDEYIAAYEKKSHCVRPRDLHPELPSRTVTCRNLAGATSDMLRVKLKDGRRKRISVREAARLQSFPDWFDFAGNESRQFYQIGNAVPPMLAHHIALAIKETYYKPCKSLSEIQSINEAECYSYDLFARVGT